MCLECGCGEGSHTTIDGKKMEPHQHDHHHQHEYSHDHKEIEIQQDILAKNNHIALHNREHIARHNVFCMNWISAPGSGKTFLLERLIKDHGEKFKFSVIEGDQQTDNDAQRIKDAGASATQINTGSACHLDAEMIHQALHKIDMENTKILIIENVGNMVCPTAYALGENMKLSIVSCPEGEDKPIKYPDLLLTSKVLLINKIDLLPYLDFDLDRCIKFSKQVNPDLEIFPVSAKSGEGIPEFVSWLEKNIN